jgi:hypothetical protein
LNPVLLGREGFRPRDDMVGRRCSEVKESTTVC